jgi:hypothetical protein
VTGSLEARCGAWGSTMPLMVPRRNPPMETDSCNEQRGRPRRQLPGCENRYREASVRHGERGGNWPGRRRERRGDRQPSRGCVRYRAVRRALLPNTANASDLIFPQFGRTESDGRFSSSYSGGRHDLFVRVYDTVKRKLGISSIHHDVAIGMSSSSASSASRAPPTLPRPRSLDRCNSSWGLD